MKTLREERIERVIGRRPPILGPTSRRAVVSALVAIPVGFTAFGIADKAPIPDWLRFVISPGVLVAFRFVEQEACKGLLDCLVQALGAYAKGAGIACIINAFVYGILIFGIATTRSTFFKRYLT